MTSIVFFGSSVYSTIILKSLLSLKNFSVVAVVTKPDKPVGRDQKITKNPVAAYALENNLTLLQPEDFTSKFQQQLSSFQADLGLCVAFGPPFFNQGMIESFPLKIINIHPSPLPLYRGATPGPWQIINGETKSAVTFFVIDEKPDHGPLITQIPFTITPQETSDSFYNKAFSLAADNLGSVLNQYLDHPQNLITQNDSLRTYYPRLNKESAQIDWSWEPQKIERFVRALIPWPVAWTYVQDQKGKQLKMKIFQSQIKDGVLIPQKVQIENKNASDWKQIEKYYRLVY